MPTLYELTPAQRDAWRTQIGALFMKESNCSKLAKQGGFGDNNEKTTAGYIGEFRDGKARGIGYFLGEPARLERLARALDADAEQILSIWRTVHQADAVTSDVLMLPGFEDWGTFPLDDAFVLPPLERSREPVNAADARKFLLKDLPRHVRVLGSPGSGVTTLLRRMAAWAREDGWRVTWGADGQLPAGRAELLVLDGPCERPSRELVEWAKAPGHALLHGGDPSEARIRAGLLRSEIARQTWSVLNVTEEWASGFLGVVQRLAPRVDARRCQAVRPPQLRTILDELPAPTPELVGALTRALVDSRPTGLATNGLVLATDAARRRLRGSQRRDQETLLRGAESWLGDAYFRHLDHPDRPLHESAETAMIGRARAVVDEIQATAAQRDVLRAVLPYADASGAVEALRMADMVGGSDRESFRFEPFLAAATASRALGSSNILRQALVGRRRALLSALVRTAGGPRAVATALSNLNAPALATVLAEPARDADWLSFLRWDAALVARVVAMLIATGRVDSVLPRPKRKGARSTMEPDLWSALGHATDTPTAGEVRSALLVIAAELVVPVREISDPAIRMLLGFLAPESADLHEQDLWAALPDELFPYPPWVDRLVGTPEGLALLTDASESAVAERLLGIKVLERVDLLSGEEQAPHRRWIPMLRRLADLDAATAAEVLARMFRAAVEETLAHRGEPLERFEADAPASYETPVWHGRINQLVSGVAEALQAPEVRRREKQVRTALRAQLSAWRTLAASEDVPIEAWIGNTMLGHSKEHRALSVILRFTLTEAERVAELRGTEGTLSPFWWSLLHAGVPTAEAVRLMNEVAEGLVRVVPGRGTPSKSQMAAPEQSVWGRRQTIESWIFTAILEACPPDDLPQLPDFPPPGSGIDPAPELIEGFSKFGPNWPNVRQYLWRFVRTLAEDSIVWTLIGAEQPYGTSFEHVREVGRRGTLKVAFDLDSAGLTAAIALVPVSSLSVPQWERLANAGLLACLGGAMLAPLLVSPSADAARGTLLAELLRVVQAEDRAVAARWILDRLRDRPLVVDAEPFVDVLATSSVPDEALLAYIESACVETRCGDGVVLALVRRGIERFAAWLARDETRDAALSALTRLPDWEVRLGAALGDSERVPAVGVLADLLRREGGAGFDVLDLAAERWPTNRQRQLWQSALAAAPDGRVRAELWRRLAALD